MKAIALTLPIAPSKIEAWRRFCQELSGSRLWLYVASRRTLGVTHESLVLVETLAGSSVVMSLDSGDIDVTVEKIVASRFPFDTWYRERMMEMHGISFADYRLYTQPPVSPIREELVLEWTLRTSRSDR